MRAAVLAAGMGLPGTMTHAQPLPEGSYQTADIGSWFDNAARESATNQTIIDLGDIFQKLYEGWPYNDEMASTIFLPYYDELVRITPEKYKHSDIQTVPGKIDVCVSLDAAGLYRKYYERLQDYIADNPYLLDVPGQAELLKNAETLIDKLDALNKQDWDWQDNDWYGSPCNARRTDIAKPGTPRFG